jgi:hypothetical protein
MTETLEHSARLIAERGRDALVARLRPAFVDAAATHADVLELSPEQLEEMVQRAADRADGLQWRRALASVATEELGISLGEALTHPAVVRAQAIVGAPSYEESLAELGRAPAREEPVAEPGQPLAEPDPAEPDAHQAEEAEEHEEPEEVEEHEEHGQSTEPHAALAEEEEDEDELEPEEELELEEELEPGELRLAATHLGGIANLAPAESDLELHFSDHGLDIVRGTGHIFGRLRWEEVTALDVPEPRGILKRRRAHSAHLVIRSAPGDASFEIPALTPEELREQLTPLNARLGG